MENPKLFVMVGISGSGKSTKAEEISRMHDAIIVSSDSIREEICEGGINDQSKNTEVFKIFHQRIRKNLEDGRNVVADATNITMKSRRAIFQNIKNIECIKIAVIMNKPYEECLRDNNNRERTIPAEVIEKQMMRFEVPFYEEGFTDIELIFNGTKTMPDMVEEMVGFNQQNPHHNLTLFEHCFVASNILRKQCATEILISSALVHDIGKKYTQTFDEDGVAHYYQHHNVGAYYYLCSLHYDNFLDELDIIDIAFYINYHMLPYFWKEEKTYERYKRFFRERYDGLMRLHEADKAAKGVRND